VILSQTLYEEVKGAEEAAQIVEILTHLRNKAENLLNMTKFKEVGNALL
jgi:hypothetical protein